jgi:alginate O-acetyltransferase complex protein AlgI
MIFYGLEFIIFFVVFLAAFFAFPKGSARSWYVLVASYLFYGWWYPPYLVLLLGLSWLAFWGGLLIKRQPKYLPLIVIMLLLPLGFFKYASFVIDNFFMVSGIEVDYRPDWVLPLGISFITFTAIAYVVDVRRGVLAAEKTFRQVSLFIAFFPQLVAGPILRGRELMPQLANICPRWRMLPFGLLLFAFGTIKKVVLADGIGGWVDRIYASMEPLTMGESLVAIYGFSVQIYCDFSGYTDMAIGLGAFLGVWLPRNFERPYLATTIRDFWRCWHMTLSRWLRDYLYIWLGGNRHGFTRMLLAVMVTMLLGGLWHGASWTFVIWGGLHGLLIAIEQIRVKLLPNMALPPLVIRRLWLLHFIAGAWILFRAQDLDEAAKIINGLAVATNWASFAQEMAWPLVLISIAVLLHPFDSIARIRLISRKLPHPVTLTISIMALAICIALSIGNPGTFIYFDF